MVDFSNGLPIVMQEIGDAVFFLTSENKVTEGIAYRGLIEAANNIGKKYLNPKVFDTLQSKKYRKILKEIGNSFSKMTFTVKELKENLDEPEKKVLNNFLSKMKELGVIFPDKESGRGAYKFENYLFAVFIWLQHYNSADQS